MLKKSLIGFIGGSVLLVAAIVYLIGFHRPRYESPGPLSLAEAKAHLKVELPSDAKWIYVLNESVGPGHFRCMIRFQAPLASCFAWAERVRSEQTGWQAHDVAAETEPTNSRVPVWFEVHSIQDGRGYVSDGTPMKRIWIDRRKETAYYSETD